MAQRQFKLPGVDQLNKDQDKVLRLPEDGQYLIIGGPGTGKSVVALLRTLKYLKNNNYIFLTYNKVLLSSCLQLVQRNLRSRTLTSFIYKEYSKQFSKATPEIKKYIPDYEQIIKDFEKLNKDPISLHLIIDEGQDMPPKYYEALIHLGIENFFIVADQNQQITDQNSSIKELANILGLEYEIVKDNELNVNYRNSHPIALFASEFYTDPASPPPDLPPPSKTSLGTPVLYKYSYFQDCVKAILQEADKDTRNLIGVVVANDRIRDKFIKSIEKVDIQLDNQKPIISTYTGSDKIPPNIDFTQRGIIVLNDKSIKGLEFDIVFIILDGFKIHNNDTLSMKKRFYVMSSRAIKKLILFQNENDVCGVEKIMPTDENILKRKRYNYDSKK